MSESGCGTSIVQFCTSTIGSFINAWTLTLYWTWFVMPFSDAIPHLGYAHAFGVNLLIALFHMSWGDKIILGIIYNNTTKDASLSKNVSLATAIAGILIPLMRAGAGAIIHSFM